MKFHLPQNIKFVLDTFLNNGHKAYIVGGCVRDLLCGKEPHDYDVTTSALPEETQRLFEKTIATGIKHGTVTVVIDNTNIEVTTFRTESVYNDARHPESVNFVSDVKDDLARRDFTVNAMCYNDQDGLIDLFGGVDDINNKTLRAVGNAETRFTEDALRILRLFRFASTLQFQIEKNTFDAAVKCAHLLKHISAERIFTELEKAAMGENISVIAPLLQTDALENYYIKDGNLTNINNLKSENMIRTFALLNAVSYNLEGTLNTLKCSNIFKDYCLKMQYLILNNVCNNKENIKLALNYADYDIVCDYLLYRQHILNADISISLHLLQEILENKEPYKISHLNVSGKDITALGFDGKAVGDKLNFLLNEVIKNPTLNEREKLLNLICN